jgi:hypothetical protein
MLLLINNKTNSQIHLTNNGLYRGKSVQKSVHFHYTISGIPFSSKKQKPSKLIVSRVFQWAQMDSNHRPSDYEDNSQSSKLLIYIKLSMDDIVFDIVNLLGFIPYVF